MQVAQAGSAGVSKGRLQNVVVNERNVLAAGRRALPEGAGLVTPELEYLLQRMGGQRIPREELVAEVTAVRRLPWGELGVDPYAIIS